MQSCVKSDVAQLLRFALFIVLAVWDAPIFSVVQDRLVQYFDTLALSAIYFEIE